MQGFKPKPARAFTTTASERDREQATRDQARAAQARVETVEKYSGLRIKNRVVAGMVVEDRFNDLRFYRLKDLRHTISGRWATAGVLVEKSVKQSSNGGSYSVWKLSDLGRDDVCVSVFLFGQAHIDNWKEPEGTIWSIVDAQLNESKGERDKGRPSATVDGKDPRALWKLGASADFGRCKGARKDGNNCTMHVNRSLTEYCAYHAASALKAFRQSDRMNVGVRRAPKFTVNGRTVLGTKGEFISVYFRMGNWIDGVFCSTLTGNGSAPNMPPGAHAGGYRPHTAGATNRGTNQHQQPTRTYGEEERRVIAARHGSGAMGSRGAAMLGGVKREGATAKANQAARFASTFAKQTTKQQTVHDADADITLFDEEDGDLAAFEDKIKDLAAIERARAVANSLRTAPDPNDWRRKPLADVRVSVNANKQAAANPRAPNVGPGAAKRDATEAGMPREGAEGVKKPVRKPVPKSAPGSFGDVFGAVLDTQDDTKGSRYADDAAALEHKRLMSTMESLEKQDQLYTQLTTTRSMKVTASRCTHPGCGVVYEGRKPTRCFEERHQAKPFQAEKRWFKCASGNCHGRCTTLSKPFPPHKCHKCGCDDWDRTGIPASAGAAGKGFEEEFANSTGMLARGVEHGFSLGGGGAVYAGGAAHQESAIE